MSYPARTLFGFGCYRLLLGALLILFPNALLGLLGIAPTVEVWVRVAGMLMLFLGAYDVLAGMAELRQFIVWSVPIRACAAPFFAVFILLGYAPTVVLSFGAIDLACALWTWLALRQARAAAPATA